MVEPIPGTTPDEEIQQQFNQLEALRSQSPEIQSFYQASESLTKPLAIVERLKPAEIPFAMRWATEQIILNEVLFAAGIRKLDARQHPYLLDDVRRKLTTLRLVRQAQLYPEQFSDAPGILSILPKRIEIPVKDEFGQPIVHYYWEEIPMTRRDKTPIMDDKGNRKVWTRRVEVPITQPVGDEQLKAAIKEGKYCEKLIAYFDWAFGDVLTKRRLSSDIEKLAEGFMANWRDNPTMAGVGFLFNRPETLPGLEKHADLLQKAMDGWEEVGNASPDPLTDGLRNIFYLPSNDAIIEIAIRHVTGRILGLGLEEVPSLEELEDPRHEQALGIALEALGYFRYFSRDVTHACVLARNPDNSLKLIEQDDRYCKEYGFVPGPAKRKIDVGKMTASDDVKVVHFVERLASETDHDYPYYVGVARYLICAAPELSLSSLQMISAERYMRYQNKDGKWIEKMQRLSYQQFLERGVAYKDLPWVADDWKDGHQYFNEAYETSEEEAKLWEEYGKVIGSRDDGFSVPNELQEYYAAVASWLATTVKDVDKYFETMTNPGLLGAENKPLDLAFKMMSADLVIDPEWEERYGTINKLIQVWKAHKLAAAYLGKCSDKEESLYSALSANPEVSFLQNIREGLLRKARRASYLSSRDLTFTVPGQKVNKVSAREKENNLFAKIIKEGPLTPKATGLYTDRELIKIARLYPFGVGYTQAEMEALLVKGTIRRVVELRDLGWTSRLSDETKEKLKTRKNNPFTEQQIAAIDALAVDANIR